MIEGLPTKSIWKDKTGKLHVNIWPKQHQFLSNENIDEIFYGGAAGGGKSEALLHFALQRRLKYPKTLGIIFRRKFPDLQKSLILRSKNYYGLAGGKYNESKHEWKFPNGSVQMFGFCKTDGDVYDHQSAEYHDMGFDELTHFCVHPNTDVLTRRGWIKISEVKLTDKVASLSKTKKIVFKRPSRIWEFPYSGKMLEVNQRKGMAFSVTPNHRMVIREGKGWKFERADSLSNFSFHIRTGNLPKGNAHTGFSFPTVKGRGHGCNGNQVNKPIARWDWLEFLGWYLAEGCAFEIKTKKGKWTGPQVCIRQMKRVPILEALLDRLGWRWRYFDTGVYKIFSRQLFEIVKPLGDTYTKRVPEYVFSSEEDSLRLFFSAFIAGDGYRGKHGSVHFGLANQGLIDDLQYIATLLGLISSKGYSKTKTGFDVWRLNVSNSKRQTTEVRKKDIKEVPYVGSVWCLTMEPHHTFFARYNGKVFITGNTEFQFGYLTSRCRSSMPGVKALIRGASNPGNIGHLWVKKRYIDPSKTNKIWYNSEEHKQMTFISSLLDDNPSLRLNDPTYEHRLRILGEKKFQALRFGNWDVFEGQYFDEWDARPGYSVLTGKRVPEKHHRKFLAMDWGFANPACVLWFEVTPTGRVFVYRELYTSRRTNKQLAADVLMMCPDEEKYEGIYIPPELFGKKSEKEGGGETYAEEMQSVFQNRISILKANNARIPGWIKVRQYLSPAQDGYPWLQISTECPNLVRTLPMQIHDENHPEDLDTDGEDHAPDTLRYGVVALNEIPRMLVTPRSFIDNVFGRRDDDSNMPMRIPMPGRGGYG